MSTLSSISMFSMYFVSCLGRGEGGGSSLSLLGGMTRPDFCSWPSRLFQAFRPEHFSRYNLLPGQGVQQVTVPFIPWCYKLQNVRTRPLESVIGRRRALYNKRYQGDLPRLQNQIWKAWWRRFLHLPSYFPIMDPHFQLTEFFATNVIRFSMCIGVIICFPKLFSWPYYFLL